MKIDLAVEPHAILVKGGANSDSGGGAEVIRIKRDADAVINRQDQFLVSLSPILDDGDVGWCTGSRHEHPFLRLVRHC